MFSDKCGGGASTNIAIFWASPPRLAVSSGPSHQHLAGLVGPHPQAEETGGRKDQTGALSRTDFQKELIGSRAGKEVEAWLEKAPSWPCFFLQLCHRNAWPSTVSVKQELNRCECCMGSAILGFSITWVQQHNTNLSWKEKKIHVTVPLRSTPIAYLAI